MPKSNPSSVEINTSALVSNDKPILSGFKYYQEISKQQVSLKDKTGRSESVWGGAFEYVNWNIVVNICLH